MRNNQENTFHGKYYSVESNFSKLPGGGLLFGKLPTLHVKFWLRIPLRGSIFNTRLFLEGQISAYVLTKNFILGWDSGYLFYVEVFPKNDPVHKDS